MNIREKITTSLTNSIIITLSVSLSKILVDYLNKDLQSAQKYFSLSLDETYTIDGGGIPWGNVIKAVVKFAVETIAACGISKCCDEVTEKTETDIEVDYVYDGGVLDAAVCQG